MYYLSSEYIIPASAIGNRMLFLRIFFSNSLFTQILVFVRSSVGVIIVSANVRTVFLRFHSTKRFLLSCFTYYHLLSSLYSSSCLRFIFKIDPILKDVLYFLHFLTFFFLFLFFFSFLCFRSFSFIFSLFLFFCFSLSFFFVFLLSFFLSSHLKKIPFLFLFMFSFFNIFYVLICFF